MIHSFLFSDTDPVRVSPYLCIRVPSYSCARVPSYLYTVFVKTRTTRACKKYRILSFLSPNFRPLGAFHSCLLYIPSSSLFLACSRFLFDSLHCHSRRFNSHRFHSHPTLLSPVPSPLYSRFLTPPLIPVACLTHHHCCCVCLSLCFSSHLTLLRLTHLPSLTTPFPAVRRSCGAVVDIDVLLSTPL